MSIFFADEQSVPVEADPLVALAELVLVEQDIPTDVEMSVLLVTSEQIAEYNERFMSKSGPTDVLSFPIVDLAPGERPRRVPNGPPTAIGDVFICPEVVRANAGASGVPFEDEMALMVVHGILHLLGFDHQVDDEAEIMESREADILAKIGKTRP
ncbi:MAG: rRNA maturation RNase YbeY [Acidimicrobiia bacterium]|nr:rRNA maturation RNase YbeY [Acidimicrobiia bacterium]NNF63180.1 rRNA maturation RNase YbeY [Acidimicrobiia bacterium]